MMKENEVSVAIGQRVRRRRILLQMSQEALATAIGVRFQQLQKYESGINRMTCDRLVFIAKALGCSPGDLLNDLVP